ncbi:MAG: hypothetical protein JWO52_1528, partial [Gammaproteobacteria bacterium]|nr:hypothetical protein [Gammaproteobacteria bacterium]
MPPTDEPRFSTLPNGSAFAQKGVYSLGRILFH